ncbi:unnamed protein product [Coffea canephora]|uniref:DH200=94 genomic scaffold, scaffold_538 n=1 Tax=Coffea canephora TaxID=49390 RepID=A0A068VFB8_COFCA|nr:unnamed protein product [Coffea canephora]
MLDKKKVFSGGPWCFDDNLLVISDYIGNVQPTNIKLDTCSFWVRVYNLPLSWMNVKTAEYLGNKLGVYEGFESKGYLFAWGKFHRIRVQIHLESSLKRVMHLFIEGKVHKVLFQYERLPILCFYCGRIGHGKRDCELKLDAAIYEIAFPSKLLQHIQTSDRSPTLLKASELFLVDAPLAEQKTHSDIHKLRAMASIFKRRKSTGSPKSSLMSSTAQSSHKRLLGSKVKHLDISLNRFASNFIDAKVHMPNYTWRFTGFYGHPDASKRKYSWDSLRQLSTQSRLPWLCIGDYNEVLSQTEFQGSGP